MDLIVQPSAADSNIVNTQPVTNYGNDTNMYIGPWAGNRWRAVLSSDFSALPDGVIITAATLSLHVAALYGAPEGKSRHIYRLLTDDWTELGVCWQNRKGGFAWTNLGGDFTTLDGAAATTFAAAWVDFDVTAQVAYWQGLGKIAHMMLCAGAEGMDDQQLVVFHTKEHAVVAERPKLTITYELSTGSSRRRRALC